MVRAEPTHPDGLYFAYVQACRDIAAGKKRADALPPLTRAMEMHEGSRFSDMARRLARDITSSIDQATTRAQSGRVLDDAPVEFLSETTIPPHLLRFPADWEQGLSKFLETTPRDPAALLLKEDRKCIGRLLPQLHNRAPTRSLLDHGDGDPPQILRVCDLALLLIEKVSACKFFFNASFRIQFHELNDEQQERVIGRIREWWRENKNKTIAGGIRAQLPNGDYYGQLTMAENLIRVAGVSSPADREHGFNVLRRLARSELSGGYAARALEKYGDLSPVEWYYDELKSSLANRGRYYSQSIPALFYLAEHGGRKEWELLFSIALKDLQQERESQSGQEAHVIGSLVKSNGRSLHLMPFLCSAWASARQSDQAVATSMSKLARRRTPQLTTLLSTCKNRLAWTSAIAWQGPLRSGPPLSSALKSGGRRRGQAKYTFDYIEKNLTKSGTLRRDVP
jgi:hypothetical protein